MTEPRTPLSEEVAEQEARRLIHDAYQPTKVVIDDPNIPSYADGPRAGDSRIVPQWALGIAVASIGVGAGITGIGCGVWLACQGFAAVTLNSVLFVTLPIAGLAVLATAISGLINKAKKAAPPQISNHYTGTVYQDQRNVQNKNTGVWVKNTNEQ
jgi:hypothetical protein